MDDDWRIRPRERLGRLAFGMTPDEVAALRSVYGEPGVLVTNENAVQQMRDVLALTDAQLPPDQVAHLLEKARQAARLSHQVLEGAGSVHAEYRDGRLDGVMLEATSPPAHFEGRPVMALKPREALVLFEAANGRPGRYQTTGAEFDEIALGIDGFTSVSALRTVRIVSETEEDFVNRSITLRREPYRPADELHRFVSRSFL